MSFLRKVVILGTAGSGKRSLGNTLLGRNAFEVTPLFFNSATTEIEKKSNSEITVTEIPVLFNTKRSLADIALDILSNPNGCPYPHAFLIVFDATKRTSYENEVIVRLLRDLLIDTLSHAIVVFTKVNDKNGDETFERFWKEDARMQIFIEQCGGRVVRIDNQGKEMVTRARGIINLIDEKSEIESSRRYCNNVYLLKQSLATEKYKYESREYLVKVILIWSGLACFILGVGLFLMLLGFFNIGLLFFGVGTFGI